MEGEGRTLITTFQVRVRFSSLFWEHEIVIALAGNGRCLEWSQQAFSHKEGPSCSTVPRRAFLGSLIKFKDTMAFSFHHNAVCDFHACVGTLS